MSRFKNQNGFTLTEILVAVFIMSLGFLATAQMQALSLRQKQLAEEGTVSTNMIQFISDTQMAEVKRRYLLNSQAYLDAQAGKVPDLSYCNGSPTSICNGCPCDPLEAITPNPDDNVTESSCAPIDAENTDPEEIDFENPGADCPSIAPTDEETDLFVVERAQTNQDVIPTTGQTLITVSVTYAVKTEEQVEESDLSVDIGDSLVSQRYEVTAHVDDWSDYLPGWTQVRIPHIP